MFVKTDIKTRFARIIFSGQYIQPILDRNLAKIYFDYGSGFSEENHASFVIDGSQFNIDAVCELKGRVNAIRFDPIEAPGKFVLERFAVIPQQTETSIVIDDMRPMLIPVNQLEGLGEDRWRAVGHDPYFHSPLKTNSKALRISIRIRIYNRENISTITRTQFFFDFGVGYNEQDSHSVYTDSDEVVANFTVKAEGPIQGIRLDPTDRACDFEISHFAFSGITLAAHHAAQRLEILKNVGRQSTVARLNQIAVACFGRGSSVECLHRQLLANRQFPDAYSWWIKSRGIPDKELFSQLVQEDLKFSIIMPTYNPPLAFLAKAIDSVRAQTYQNWELCIVDDGSKDNLTAFSAYMKAICSEDPRIKFQALVENQGISVASNNALSLATGDFIALIDQDDEIAPHALSAIAIAIKKNPEADWLYTDEDKIDEKGVRSSPYFKPDWSPAFFLSCMYTCHLGVYRRSLVNEIGGFRSKLDFAQDYDLALRVSKQARSIVHVPDILYHWRTLPESTASGAHAKPTAEINARLALSDFLSSNGTEGEILDGAMRGMHRPSFKLKETPLVSIAIPSAGASFVKEGEKRWFILDLVRSIIDKTTYEDFEIIIADNNDFDPALIEFLSEYNVKIVHFAFEQFNLSEKMNFVVNQASGEFVIILNDDMTIITDDWIEQMLMWCQQGDVAAVGAKLIFPDDKIQHAGILMLGQGPSHPYYLHEESTEIGLVGNAVAAHEASAVTGACLMVRKADYEDVGGFDPVFRINYNDVDFCMRLRSTTGKRIVWTPYAKLYHYESVSREEPPKGELEALESRWKFGADPYYNPHLSQYSGSYELGMDVRSINDDYKRQCAEEIEDGLVS
ncbi:glycosyltransferase family 2 protein [Agrobacterium rosae]|uniref:glycosyltransferase family 2 protein n=1 Tax=Agrobacterium rosae TaxID=1972867 RepID=UPI003BA0E474